MDDTLNIGSLSSKCGATPQSLFDLQLSISLIRNAVKDRPLF